MSDYCEDIAEIISDYRKKDRKNGELRIKSFDKYHVERWARQFPENNETVLSETEKLLQQFYFSKDKMSSFLASICRSKVLWGDSPEDAISNTCFLNCQSKGNSQHHLWKKATKMITQEYGVIFPELPDLSQYTTFVYLDDCMFSGNTLAKDMRALLPDLPCGAKVYAVFTIVYSFANWWVKKQLEPLFQEKNISFEILYRQMINNSNGANYPFDCLRPPKYESEQLDEYLAILQMEHEATPDKKCFTFRDRTDCSAFFSSEEARSLLEYELMEAGLYIRSLPKNPKQYMRPMGYDNRISFGFGAFFATYMNMSNNCPLAYWWGDPDADEWNPLSKWYPLLPRKVNDAEGRCAW